MLHLLKPIAQNLTVETDLLIRMQQDDSYNPSVIYAIGTDDLRHMAYT